MRSFIQQPSSGGGDGGGGGGSSSLEIVTAMLASGAGESGLALIGPANRMLRVGASRPSRVRLYTTEAKRDADIWRPDIVDPTGDHGLVMEVILTTATPELNLEGVPLGVIAANAAYRIDNRDTVAGIITVTLLWQQEE